MKNLSLYHISEGYKSAFLDLCEMEVDEQTMLDTIEGMEGALTHKMANVAAFIQNLELEGEIIAAALQRIKARESATKNKAKRLREYLIENMVKTGIKKVEALDHTFSVTLLAPRASMIIDDEITIPAEFLTEAKSYVVDKAALKKALETGLTTSAAHLEYRQGLMIK